MLVAVVFINISNERTTIVKRRKKKKQMNLPLKGHIIRDEFYTYIVQVFIYIIIQRSNCWTDRTICLNKTDANVGESVCVRAYIHAYVRINTMCL